MLYRDLGGIRNKEGKTIKKNFLFRSANLSKINAKTLKKLKDMHLYKIIDLRTSEEASERPDKAIDNVQYIHMPLLNVKTVGITYEKDTGMKEMIEALPNMADLYRSMVTSEYSVSQIKQIIREIIESDGFPILFHCTAGKDRTGIVALLLLSILDVDKSEIIKDYLYESKKHKLKSLGLYLLSMFVTGNRALASKVRTSFLVDEKYLIAAIQAINEKYGSIDAFIKNELDISDIDKEAFKSTVLCV